MCSFLVYTLGYTDCACGADQAAQMAAYTFGSYYLGLAGVGIKTDSLMTAVIAGYVAASAAYALFTVNLGIYQSVAVQAGGQDKCRQLLANQFIQTVYTAFCHVGLHTQNQVIDYAVAVLHHGSAYLNTAAAQLDELQGITPGLYTAYAAILHFTHDRVGCHLLYKTQCIGLTARPEYPDTVCFPLTCARGDMVMLLIVFMADMASAPAK